MVGSLSRDVIQLIWTTTEITIHNVNFVPELYVNVISVNKALKKYFKFSSEGETISFSKNHVSITIDKIYCTKEDGTVSGAKRQACSPRMANHIEVNKFHEMLGHCGAERLQNTAHVHGIKLKGTVEVCEDCAIAKARQKNVNKKWKGGSQVPAERLYLDIRFVRGSIRVYLMHRLWRK